MFSTRRSFWVLQAPSRGVARQEITNLEYEHVVHNAGVHIDRIMSASILIQ